MGRTRAGVKRERGAEGAEDSAGHELQASTPDTVKKRRTAQVWRTAPPGTGCEGSKRTRPTRACSRAPSASARRAQAAGAVKVKIEPPAEESDLGKARVKLEVKQEPTEETEQECAAPVRARARMRGQHAFERAGAPTWQRSDESACARMLVLTCVVMRVYLLVRVRAARGGSRWEVPRAVGVT